MCCCVLIKCSVNFCVSSFVKGTWDVGISNMFKAFGQLLNSIVDRPQVPIFDLKDAIHLIYYQHAVHVHVQIYNTLLECLFEAKF